MSVAPIKNGHTQLQESCPAAAVIFILNPFDNKDRKG